MKHQNEQHLSSGTSKRYRLLENNWHPLQHAEHAHQLSGQSQYHKRFNEQTEEINSIIKQHDHWPNHTPEEMDPVPDMSPKPEDDAQNKNSAPMTNLTICYLPLMSSDQ